MTKPSSLLVIDSDLHGLETLTYGFEREGVKVTRTSDLSRAVQLSRSGSPGLVVVMVREPATPAMDVIAALHGAHRDLPILALGDAAVQTQARAAGASDFLRTPVYIRDVVNAAKLNAYGDDAESLLSEYHGLFYVLRAMSATARSCVLRLSRGSRRAEIRFKDGKVVSANVRALQHLPALHHVLLWEEAALSIAGGAVAKPSQFPLSTQEILDECERFLRDFAHAARDLGPPSTIYVPVAEPRPVVTGMQPGQMAPLLRLFDGKRGLSDVVEESPFRIFDTIRMIRRLYENGVLVNRAQQQRRSTGEHRRLGRPTPPANGALSMLGQWAMVPDQRGVVGDRRGPSRPLMPFGRHVGDQPGMGGDRRRQSQPVKPLATPGPTPLPTPGPTPLPATATATATAPAAVALTPEAVLAAVPVQEPASRPIPLTNKKAPSGAILVKSEVDAVAGEIPPVKRRTTPASVLALEPTVQVKVDKDGTPLELPPARTSNTPSPERLPPVRTHKTPIPLAPPVRANKTPIPTRVTPAAAFDAIEADFFAREADLYKRDAIETFDDLDPSRAGDKRSSSARRRRK